MKPPQKASREVSNPQPGSWRPGKPPSAPNPAPRAELKHLNALPQPCPQRGAAPARAQQSPHSLLPAGENSRLTAQLGEGGEEESRGLFTRGRDLAVKTPREGKKKIINRSLEGNEAAQKAPVLPRAARRRDNEVPASSQPGASRERGNSCKTPASRGLLLLYTALHGAQHQPHSPALGSHRSWEFAFPLHAMLPVEERRGPGVCARPGPAHLARRVCFIFFFIIIIILRAEEPRKPNKGPAELGLPWERINKPRESTNCRGGADSRPGRAPRHSHPRPSALGTELKGLRGHGDSQSCGDSL